MTFSQTGIKPVSFFPKRTFTQKDLVKHITATSIITIILPSISCADRKHCGSQNNTHKHKPWTRPYPEPISWWAAQSRRTAWSWRGTPAVDGPLWSRLGGFSHPRIGPTRSEPADPERWWTTRRERQTSWRDSVISDPTERQKRWTWDIITNRDTINFK